MARGQEPWAEGAALAYEAGGCVLSAQGGRDVQGILGHKSFLQASTRRTTFARFSGAYRLVGQYLSVRCVGSHETL